MQKYIKKVQHLFKLRKNIYENTVRLRFHSNLNAKCFSLESDCQLYSVDIEPLEKLPFHYKVSIWVGSLNSVFLCLCGYSLTR